jgi:hypothetical protein
VSQQAGGSTPNRHRRMSCTVRLPAELTRIRQVSHNRRSVRPKHVIAYHKTFYRQGAASDRAGCCPHATPSPPRS